MRDIQFIDVPDLIDAHQDIIDDYGGLHGIRDEGSIESACAIPRWYVDHGYLYSFPFGMAAAYMFFLAKNHGFMDGNKRIALFATLVFLRMNGFEFTSERKFGDDKYVLVELVVAVAANKVIKEQLKDTLGLHFEPCIADVDFTSAYRRILTEFDAEFRELIDR